jgi:AcrR family transcriptional regulator
MAAIAEAADVSVGTLYNHFDNKDALYVELVREKATLFRDRLTDALGAGGQLPAIVDRFLEELLRLFQAEAVSIRLYWRVNAQARISFRATLAEPLRRMFDETMLAFARVIDGNKRHGEPTPQAYRAALCCQVMLGELFLLHIDDPKRHPEGAVLAEAKRILRAVTEPFGEDRTAMPRSER